MFLHMHVSKYHYFTDYINRDSSEKGPLQLKSLPKIAEHRAWPAMEPNPWEGEMKVNDRQPR